MITIKKILVPTDFSKGAEKTYPVAQSMADRFGGTIDFINIIPTYRYINESIKRLGLPLDMNEDVYPKVIDESEHQLSKSMTQYLKEKNRGKGFVKIERNPAEAIVEHAQKNRYDLILMGARGMHKSKFMRGGTTERVVRKSKIPVFSVDEKFDINRVRHVVMPTDSSVLSLAAFPFTASLADAFGADITFFHVLELYGSVSEEIPITAAKGETISIYEAIIDRLNEYLTHRGTENMHIQRTGVTFEDELVITDGENSRTIPLFTKIEKGISAHYEIHNYASESADLVVMATHGHSGFAHLILGSTAEKVVQYIKKPVITVRPGANDFVNS